MIIHTLHILQFTVLQIELLVLIFFCIQFLLWIFFSAWFAQGTYKFCHFVSLLILQYLFSTSSVVNVILLCILCFTSVCKASVVYLKTPCCFIVFETSFKESVHIEYYFEYLTMEDTVTSTSKVPASTWLNARRAFFYDCQVWTDTVFFLRKQWKLFRNLMFFKGYQKHFVSSSFDVWTWKSWITNNRKFPGFEWVTIMWSSFCAVLFILSYIRFIYATL